MGASRQIALKRIQTIKENTELSSLCFLLICDYSWRKPFQSDKNTTNLMAKYKCPCRYTYDPAKGDPTQGVAPGTPFEELPDTWRCPRCKRKKEKFVLVEEVVPEPTSTTEKTTGGIDLAAYMSESIRNIMAKAYKNVLTNPREAKFVFAMQRTFEKAEKRRRKVLESEGLEVPPFLISSISTTCNLHCKGCYARSNGIAEDNETKRKQTLSPEQWRTIFSEAASMGINFSLLAGGEPLIRKDILEAVSEVKDMIFPIFTNGTLLGASYIEFLRKHLNMIPIISIEGNAAGTDERRGKGVFQRAMQAMEMLKKEDLFFGASITVTTENMAHVTAPEFIEQLRSYGCKIVFYVEYVPTEPGTEHLAFDDEHVLLMEQTMEQRRNEYSDIIFLSFPGDEKALGGCLASGRGFFHIGPDGSAEPCPFSPFSDSNVADMGVRRAMQSPLFRKIRAARALGWEHTGGCTLFEHREEIEKMMNEQQ